jgi:hypothetical protein
MKEMLEPVSYLSEEQCCHLCETERVNNTSDELETSECLSDYVILRYKGGTHFNNIDI